jgi:acetylornithine deacetylase/succinyl-diaminopimelate desuccinylase-like protein
MAMDKAPKNPDQLDDYVEHVRPDFEKALSQLVAVPTVSADPAHQAGIKRGADLAVRLLTDAGFEARAVPTPGNPVVFGRLVQDPKWPTVSIYNHLDVQPAERSEWAADPFALQIDGARYFGRGASDDKGPALTALMAVVFARAQKLPLNFQFIWELEEEIGSPHFEHFVKGNRAQLATDSIIVADTIWIAAGKPAVPVGLRGMAAFSVSLSTGTRDVHSGATGGAARNPLGELAAIITECYNPETGRVLVPGFYDQVQAPTEAELADFLASGFNVKQFMTDHGLTSLRTSDAAAVLKRIWAEPTFEVHGISGGYAGPGVKTIIPPEASAKISCRLVPHQVPAEIFELIRKFIATRHPDAVVELEAILDPWLSSRSGPYARAADTAFQASFGTRPAFVREGGSIGAVLTLEKYLKVPICMLSLGLPAHNAHAPAESFDWGQASGGIKLFAHYFDTIAKIPRQ